VGIILHGYILSPRKKAGEGSVPRQCLYTPRGGRGLHLVGFLKLALAQYSVRATDSQESVETKVEVTKALAALRPLYGKDNVEIVTTDGSRIRGIIRSMKTTQALTTPSVKIERADGEVIKIVFSHIAEIIDHNQKQ
jgi:hypothetical protein